MIHTSGALGPFLKPGFRPLRIAEARAVRHKPTLHNMVTRRRRRQHSREHLWLIAGWLLALGVLGALAVRIASEVGR